MLKQAYDPLPHPRRFAPDLPEGVEKVLLKALAKRPEDRCKRMGDFVAALDRLTSGEGGCKPVYQGCQPFTKLCPDHI